MNDLPALIEDRYRAAMSRTFPDVPPTDPNYDQLRLVYLLGIFAYVDLENESQFHKGKDPNRPTFFANLLQYSRECRDALAAKTPSTTPPKPGDKDYLQRIARDLEAKLPDGHGFLLIVPPFATQPGGHCAYIANVQREDAIKLLKELLIRWGQAENWMQHIR